MKKKLSVIIVSLLLCLSPVFVLAEDDDSAADKYNLFNNNPNFQNLDGADLLLYLGKFALNTLQLVSIAFTVFKVAQALIVNGERDAMPHQKSQMMQEIFEPVKGWLIFACILPFIRILVRMILGIDI